ncbi:hypothetical protein A2318_01850 [Candidatus Uhrbacteria bacterium RIFOXYB2_FULL_45_11]|uniref:ADP-ribosylglycohydrolase n=1 Tax=Candidatus Uhrbacteria bacterium RIFOXYB2_FULL_45_11 TaxID=1802421 RepID=A0A1F7W2C4_9BACT|nr:MAG: hypothetical protein A2318_01850 [Candidatus Uhrbacteria bacterium RIFOXYB2_FULL_45_11]
MLLFIAIGDAVAAATEFVKANEHPRLIENVLRLDGYYQHPTYLRLKPSMYTDDTQMSIAVAEVLNKHHKYNPFLPCIPDFADAWTRVFHRDPRDGYARGFQAFLESHKTGKAFLRDIRPDSSKNGACMRVVPVGVLSSTDLVLDIAAIQAETTHNTPIGIFSAQAVALMSHFALYRDEPFDRLQDFLEIHLPDSIFLHHMRPHRRWDAPVRSPATNTVHAVFDLLTHYSTLSEVLRGAIQFGGDTDSVAAIALGIASARMPNDLPQVLFDKLENGPYGRDYLKTLGKQLMDAHT